MPGARTVAGTGHNDGVKLEMAKKTAKPVKPVKSVKRVTPVKAAKPVRKPAKKSVAAKAPTPKAVKAAKKYVYAFASGKAEGDRTMKDILGGKGSGLAEMTNAGLPVPPGFTISTAACNLWYAGGPQAAAGHRGRDDGARAQAGEGGRRAVRVDDQPAAGLGAVGREVLDARHDGHHPEPRPERRSRRGAEGADQQRPVRLRQLPPLHPDVRQRRPRDSEGQVRARVRGRQARARREGRHGPGRGRPAGDRRRATRRWSRRRRASRSRRTPCSS